MPHVASTARAMAADAARRDEAERLDIPQSAMIVVALSLASWTGIAFLIRWVIF